MAAQVALKREDSELPPAGFRNVVSTVEPTCAVPYRSPPRVSDALPTVICPTAVQVDVNNNAAPDERSDMSTAEVKTSRTSPSPPKGKKLTVGFIL